MIATTFEATGAEAAISGPAGGAAVFSKCCFKNKAAPNTRNASNNSAKMNFGLMTISRQWHHK